MPRRFPFLLRPLLLLALIVLCQACAASGSGASLEATTAARDSRWAVPVQAAGLPNLFRVSPDIYRSAQPEAAGMRSAEALGIRTVLSLRATNADPEPAEGTHLRLERVPTDTWNIDDQHVIAALRLINAAPKPILVHCRHGADRTGLAVAMYRLVFQGWSKAEAKDELINGGYGFHSLWMNIPRYIDEVDIESIRARVLGSGD
jgi:protein tyrosine/serine phosphatase